MMERFTLFGTGIAVKKNGKGITCSGQGGESLQFEIR